MEGSSLEGKTEDYKANLGSVTSRKTPLPSGRVGSADAVGFSAWELASAEASRRRAHPR